MDSSLSFWVAGHITGLFEICDSADSFDRMGSRGAGFSIERGVWTQATKTRSEDAFKVRFDGKITSEAKVTEEVVRFLGLETEKGLVISHRFEVPIGAGFSASAAGAIGTAFALNDLFDLGYDREALFRVAHCAEVSTRCGLGSVIGIWQGGFEIRVAPGAPGIGKTIPMHHQGEKVATTSFGPLETARILRDPIFHERITLLGRRLVDRLAHNPDVSEFGKLSQEFTSGVGLASPRVLDAVNSHPPGVNIGMLMLGDGFFLLGDIPDGFDWKFSLVFEKVAHETVRVFEQQ